VISNPEPELLPYPWLLKRFSKIKGEE